MMGSPVTLGPREEAPLSSPHCQFPFLPLNLLLLCLSQLLSHTLAWQPQESSVQPSIILLHSPSVTPRPYNFTTKIHGVLTLLELRASRQAFCLFLVGAFFQDPPCPAQASWKNFSL